ncbi:MAG: hypothetical protein ABTD50_22985 [Polyangiaceae bacterium]
MNIAPFPIRWFETLGVALASGAYAAVLLVVCAGFQPGADSHYHFLVAREIARGALVPDVARGLPFTVLREIPVDHCWGYHLVLAPFALVPDAEAGMKIATVVLFAAIFVSITLFLSSRRVPCAWAWALLPALFSTQDWRYLQLRGGQLILPLLFAMTHVAFFEAKTVKRRVLLLVIAYAATLSYHGGLVLLPFHAAGSAALWLLRRSELARGQVWEPCITAAGLALGLTLNPYMDTRATTWRFAVLHVGSMGRDSARLYDDQPLAEFHGFPLRLLATHGEWTLLLLATLAAVGWVAIRAKRRCPPVARESIVLSGMALAGLALCSQAMRMREYAVPVAFALLAVLSPRRQEPSGSRFVAGIVACLMGAALVLHGRTTLPLIRSHLPTHQYRGAHALLEANGARPVLNIAEADYAMLRWEYDDVVCVQALSRYFIYPYPSLFHDVWELHDHANTSEETPAILARFWDRGVRLVAAHRTHSIALYAKQHPDVLRPLFRSTLNGASIYGIDGPSIHRPTSTAASTTLPAEVTQR